MENAKKNKKVIKAAVLGGLVGGVTGLLLAPKSGHDLRQDLAEQTIKMGEKALDIRNIALDACQNVEDKAQETINTGKSWIKKGKRMASNLKILVSEIQHGALTKTSSIDTSENKDSSDRINEIPIIENEHED